MIRVGLVLNAKKKSHIEQQLRLSAADENGVIFETVEAIAPYPVDSFDVLLIKLTDYMVMDRFFHDILTSDSRRLQLKSTSPLPYLLDLHALSEKDVSKITKHLATENSPLSLLKRFQSQHPSVLCLEEPSSIISCVDRSLCHRTISTNSSSECPYYIPDTCLLFVECKCDTCTTQPNELCKCRCPSAYRRCILESRVIDDRISVFSLDVERFSLDITCAASSTDSNISGLSSSSSSNTTPSLESIQYPLMLKPIVACGMDAAHSIDIMSSWQDFSSSSWINRRIKPSKSSSLFDTPHDLHSRLVLAQSFVSHDDPTSTLSSHVYKIYSVAGEIVGCRARVCAQL